MEIPIIFEDSEIVVIDKPAGIVCNRADTLKEATLQDWWEERYREMLKVSQVHQVESEDEKYFSERSGLVHRLDRETSGVMVMAKSPQSFVELLRQFKEREVEKEYLALTHGYWSARGGEINLPIGRRKDDRQKFGVRDGGRESVTEYKVISEYDSWEFPKELKVDDRGYVGFSLVQFRPKTGRTHQIRVHAKQLGHPLVGDVAYAGRKRSREDRKWAHRVMLQAQRLEFAHPRNGKRVSFESRGEALDEVLRYLLAVKNQTPGV